MGNGGAVFLLRWLLPRSRLLALFRVFVVGLALPIPDAYTYCTTLDTNENGVMRTHTSTRNHTRARTTVMSGTSKQPGAHTWSGPARYGLELPKPDECSK